MDFDFSRYPYLNMFQDMPKENLDYQPIYPNDYERGKTYCLNADKPELLLDFSEERVGFFRFAAMGTGKIRVDYAEKLGEIYARNEDYLPDWYETPYDEFFPCGEHFNFNSSKGRRACRYIRIKAEGDVSVKDIVFINVYANNSYEGSFHCSDEKLNAIYDICKRTTRLCMQDYFEDGVKRDGLLWISDARIQMQCNYSLFGNVDLVKRSIMFFVRSMREDGWIATNATIGGANKHPDKIEYMFDFVGGKKVEGTPKFFEGCGEIYYLTYSADFIALLWEFYLYTGDVEFVKRILPYADKVVIRICKIDRFDVVGKLMPRTRYPHRQYVDNLCDEGSYYCALVYALTLYRKLYEALELDTAALQKNIDDFTKAAYEFMDEKKCVWRQWKDPEKVYVPTAQSFAYMAGLCDAEEYVKALSVMKTVPTVTAYPETGLAKYWFLKGMFEAGQIKAGLDEIKAMYGALLDENYTTCVERWDHENMQDSVDDISLSLCHGWSAGAAPLLTEYVLGVKAVEPSYKKIKISPQLCGMQYAEGEVPTVYGMIYVKAMKERVEYRVPEEIEVVQ